MKWVGKVMIKTTQTYLKKTRTTRFFNLKMVVPPGIFFPRLFFSTQTMGRYLQKLPLKESCLLEIGSGSGALSIFCAKQGALVMAVDLNPLAVQTTLMNARRNQVNFPVLVSDLFEKVSPQKFQYIINNPPFYPKNPSNIAEHAWFAGEGHSYFRRLFKSAKNYLQPHGKLLLVLTDDCDINEINRLAEAEGFRPHKVFQRNHWIEKSHVWEYGIPI